MAPKKFKLNKWAWCFFGAVVFIFLVSIIYSSPRAELGFLWNGRVLFKAPLELIKNFIFNPIWVIAVWFFHQWVSTNYEAMGNNMANVEAAMVAQYDTGHQEVPIKTLSQLMSGQDNGQYIRDKIAERELDAKLEAMDTVSDT